ncbi:hypothetical protein KORDIASMS9_01523 [Kordia sp. SMS9]|uniref:hypothetical protein n=1 Tax=Kordia sp. SMS9 TaxID=2282170 RepID=UPI000E1005C9|nr:hypothetical protein [Kordia sp. SMS9]AXG69303.1 hypothetical protein KORDIASMS9_01523 [Kordia sp. SMS9]
MKKLIFLFVLLATTVIFAQKIDRKAVYEYSDDIEFTVYSLSKSRTVDRANYRIKAEKGQKFITMVLNFKNKSSEEQIVDFETIFLIDKEDNLHEVDYFLKAGFRFTKSDPKQKLKAKKKQKIIVQFAPSIPKNETVTRLLIGEEVIELKYK